MNYVVLLPEYHLTEVFIEADSEEEAKELVEDGDGDYGTSYYRHTIDTQTSLEVYDADAYTNSTVQKILRETSRAF